MARPKKQTTAEMIKKTEELVIEKKKEYDHLVAELKRLRDLETREHQEALLTAVAKSKWSYEQIMDFIQSDPGDREDYEQKNPTRLGIETERVGFLSEVQNIRLYTCTFFEDNIFGVI